MLLSTLSGIIYLIKMMHTFQNVCWIYFCLIDLRFVHFREFPGSPVVKDSALSLWGSFPGWGTKIPQSCAPWPKKKKKNLYLIWTEYKLIFLHIQYILIFFSIEVI